ncbi:helix-turn-helix transcriptional regulator [Candidatus Woesearchaeota archaeon]|nr:helix-turn-helix transcriptional regulator [Candidatus Woesearchaeota archaeon]
MNKRLVKLLKQDGRSIFQIAGEIDIGGSNLSENIKGVTPRYENAEKICDYFGVSIDYLFPGVEEDTSKNIRLIAARERKDKIQSEAAEEMGISSSLLSKCEWKGYIPSEKTMGIICDYYGISKKRLFPDYKDKKRKLVITKDENSNNVLIEARLALGWGQKKLAEEVNVTKGYICHLEKNRYYPSEDMKDMIWEVLNDEYQERGLDFDISAEELFSSNLEAILEANS